jgi:hypothetical protein
MVDALPDARFPRIWPRPRPPRAGPGAAVDVGVAQGGVGDAVLRVVVVQVALTGELRDTVGRERVLGMILGGWERHLLP